MARPPSSSSIAALTAPNDPIVWNDRAVALAYLGRLDEAHIELNKIDPRALPELSKPAYLATKGLLLYRADRRAEGLEFYLQAMKTNASREQSGVRALVAWHLLREEARAVAPDILELTEQVWTATKQLQIPELWTMRSLIATGHEREKRIRTEPAISQGIRLLLPDEPGDRGGPRVVPHSD
jgi:tetratricopeptide (TPR) repeat protein